MSRHLPPPWLKLFLADAGRLAENPLYLRLAWRRFRRKRGIIAPRRAEFSPARKGDIGVFKPLGLAVIPIALHFAALPIVGGTEAEDGSILLCGFASFVGFLMTGAHLIGADGSPIRRFLANSAREPWGSELYLASLDARDIHSAVVAALLERGVRTVIGSVAMIALAGLLAAAALAKSEGEHVGFGFALQYLRWALPLSIAAMLEGLPLMAWALAKECEWLHPRARGSNGTADFQLVAALQVLGAHAPGAIMGFVFAYYWTEFGMTWSWGPAMLGLTLLVLPSAFLLRSFAASRFKDAAGSVGMAMQYAVREGW